eukprot:COSAG06_NODE_17_length_34906_cov_31.908268_41_plen_119_part_00
MSSLLAWVDGSVPSHARAQAWTRVGSSRSSSILGSIVRERARVTSSVLLLPEPEPEPEPEARGRWPTVARCGRVGGHRAWLQRQLVGVVSVEVEVEVEIKIKIKIEIEIDRKRAYATR